MKKLTNAKPHVAIVVWRGLLAIICLFGFTPVFALELKAELDWARQVELGTPVKGVVQQILAQPGQRVTKDEVLLTLDQRGFKSQVTGLQAQVAHFKAELAEAEREQERALELYDRTVLSDHELQVAKNNLIAAEAKYRMGQAKLVQAQLELEYSSLRAPYEAIVISRLAELGQTVVPDLQPVVLFVVADANRMLAKGQLAANEITQIAVGNEVIVKFDGEKYKGQIINFGVYKSVNDKETERRYYVNVEFSIPSRAAYLGRSATIEIP